MQQVTASDPAGSTPAPRPARASLRPRRPAEALGTDELGQIVGSLYDVANHARRATHGDPIEPAGVRVLVWVKALGSPRPSELALGLRLDLSTVSRHLRALAAEGYVQTERDANDGRAQRVSITDAGIEAIAQVVENRRSVIGAATRDWSPADRGKLAELLRRLADDLAEDKA